MKATILTCAALSGAICWLAGLDAQPPALRAAAPPSADMPNDEPPAARPMKPLTLSPRALRKRPAVEQPAPAALPDDLTPPTRPSPAPVSSGDDLPAVSRPAPRMSAPADDLSPSPGRSSESAPAPAPAPPKVAAPRNDFDDDETVPGTASVRRARRPASLASDPPPAVPDGPRKVEQVVSLEWVCPANIKAKQPFVCEIVVKNHGAEPAMNVVVHNPRPEGFKLVGADPKPTAEGELMSWSLGVLAPKQERRIRLQMTADQRGDLACKAAVSATTPTATRLKVTEPQLVVKQSCPDRVMMGDMVPVTITVSNPGDGPTDPVVLRAKMSEGLRGEKGQEMVNEIGVLAAGESRVLKLICQSLKGGAHKITTTANADGGLQSAAESTTAVSEPKMQVALSGPRLRYLDRAATYTVTVSNPGDAAANDVHVSVSVPAGFKVGPPSNGAKFDPTTRTISWPLGTVNAGEKKEVSYKCSAAQIGDHKHLAMAEGARGLRGASDLVTKVEGIASLLLELADVDDPIEVGADTAYEVRVTNHGSAPAGNVEIRALVPKGMTIKNAQGPTESKVEGQEVAFAAIPKLAPKADAVYRIMVKANAVGDVRFRARLASDSLAEPVIGEEGTKVYSDGKN